MFVVTFISSWCQSTNSWVAECQENFQKSINSNLQKKSWGRQVGTSASEICSKLFWSCNSDLERASRHWCWSEWKSQKLAAFGVQCARTYNYLVPVTMRREEGVRWKKWTPGSFCFNSGLEKRRAECLPPLPKTSKLYPWSTKMRAVFGNLKGGGDEFPNTCRVLV